MDLATYPDLAMRFRADLDAIGVDKGARLGLAVSGGPDSLALLILADAARTDCEAATIDHRLRPAAAQEAAFVAGLCAGLGVPHAILKLGPRDRGNVSAWARRARYAALNDWADARGLDYLVTAHHADDQLETVIMRLNRGSGVSGLAGIRARNGRIIRPLLGWRKTELIEVVRQRGWKPVDDPANRDTRYDRARLRKELAGANWLDPVAVAKSAAIMAEVEEALEWCVEASSLSAEDGVRRVLPAKLPQELLRRLVLRAIQAIDPDCVPRGDALARTMATLQRGEITTIGRVICIPDKQGRWSFSAAPPRRTPN